MSSQKLWQLTLTLFFVSIFLKGVATNTITPILEYPDEQAHLAQIFHYAEDGLNIDSYKNLSQELYFLEETMGTVRDLRGRNNYTYDPYFRPQYSNSTIGPQEDFLNNLGADFRHLYVKNEAAKYPPLYYLLNVLPYRLFYNSSIITRVYAIRTFSVLLSLLTAYFALLFSQQLFPKNKPLQLSLATIITFQPMFSFVSSSPNNDNGTNLVGLITIWYSLKILKTGINIKKLIILAAILTAGYFIKPLVLPLIISTACFLLFEWFYSKRSFKKQLSIYKLPLTISILFLTKTFLIPFITGNYIPYFPVPSPDATLTFKNYIIPQLGRLYRETFVWYWGIFKWLGVFLPLNLIKIIKVLLILSTLGLIKKFLDKPKKLTLEKAQLISFVIYSSAFIFSILLWDYALIRSIGFSHGLQGRYFFPTIAAHFGLFLTGFITIFPKKLRNHAGLALSFYIIFMHLISLKTIVSIYYQTAPISSLFMQMSQYKPLLFKHPFSIIWLTLYFIFLTLFTGVFTIFASKSKDKK